MMLCLVEELLPLLTHCLEQAVNKFILFWHNIYSIAKRGGARCKQLVMVCKRQAVERKLTSFAQFGNRCV